MEPNDQRSIGELMKDLRDQVTLLVRQEADLLRAEVSETAARIARNGVMVVAGLLVAYAALLVLLAAAVMGLGAGLVYAGLGVWTAAWVSPLVIGVAVVLVALLLVRRGVTALRGLRLTPDRTVDSVRAHGEWLKGKVTE